MQVFFQNFLQSTLSLFHSLHISDILDILILSLVIYKVLWFLRSSSTGRVMRGVLVLLLAMLLSSVFKLYAISFLINKAVEWGIVVLVILFQPEIRRFLERMGSGKLGSMFSSFKKEVVKPELERAIPHIIDACVSMSKSKTGALIAFERQNALDEMIKTGTTFDSSICAELLKNLFWDKAPLHDGAVICRNGKIAAAGCMLPLSANANLSRELGMRHRAGIGLSEQSDAVVIIVSEETGSISVAIGGMLKRHLSQETLEKLLHNELLEEKKEEKPAPFVLFSSLINRGKKEADTSK